MPRNRFHFQSWPVLNIIACFVGLIYSTVAHEKKNRAKKEWNKKNSFNQIYDPVIISFFIIFNGWHNVMTFASLHQSYTTTFTGCCCHCCKTNKWFCLVCICVWAMCIRARWALYILVSSQIFYSAHNHVTMICALREMAVANSNSFAHAMCYSAKHILMYGH